MTTPFPLTRTARPGPPTHLADLDMEGRHALLASLGQRSFRARQLSTHYFERLVDAPEAMTDLPAPGRADLVAATLPRLLTPVRSVHADSDATIKTAWRLADGAVIESVLMRYPRRVTICVSSQAGCGMGCPFCATGQEGLTRNLSTAEIVEQVVSAARQLRHGDLTSWGTDLEGRDDGRGAPDDDAHPVDDVHPVDGAELPSSRGARRVGNVVFMGMGEPLANYDRVVAAIRRLTAAPPDGLGVSARGITVSTVGLVPGILRLLTEEMPVTLALSLHAPDDALRDQLVPVNLRYPLADALDAARAFFDATGRRVSIEYALIRDVNDQAWRAELLAGELNRRGRGWVHVNPIPLNPTPGSRWTASRPGAQQQFVERLRGAGIPTTVRDTRGSDIDGACGQLAGAKE